MNPHVQTEFFTKSSLAWEKMLADIAEAKVSIDIEQYIFMLDTIGNRFLHLFQKKAREGVRIRILCDTVGSWKLYQSSIPKLLRSLGIDIRFFNPVKPWRMDLFISNFFRDHRKILVVDGNVAHLGGVGIQDKMADWRDTHMRIVGPLIEDISKSFQSVWENLDKGLLVRLKREPQYVKNFNILINSPRPGQRYIYQALVANIRNAQKYIYLVTPYFVPDIRLFRVLRLAAKRGVDVRLITPESGDHSIVIYARQSYFTLALKAGIKIYTFGPHFLHAKTAVIDDEWATAGSFNLDNLSSVFNHEANISSTDKAFISHIKADFLEDLKYSKQLSYEEWIKRPLRWKILELLTWPFHGIL